MINRRYVPSLTTLESRLCLSGGDPTDPIEIPDSDPDHPEHTIPINNPDAPFSGRILAPPPAPPGTDPPPVIV